MKKIYGNFAIFDVRVFQGVQNIVTSKSQKKRDFCFKNPGILADLNPVIPGIPLGPVVQSGHHTAFELGHSFTLGGRSRILSWNYLIFNPDCFTCAADGHLLNHLSGVEKQPSGGCDDGKGYNIRYQCIKSRGTNSCCPWRNLRYFIIVLFGCSLVHLLWYIIYVWVHPHLDYPHLGLDLPQLDLDYPQLDYPRLD